MSWVVFKNVTGVMTTVGGAGDLCPPPRYSENVAEEMVVRSSQTLSLKTRRTVVSDLWLA